MRGNIFKYIYLCPLTLALSLRERELTAITLHLMLLFAAAIKIPPHCNFPICW